MSMQIMTKENKKVQPSSTNGVKLIVKSETTNEVI
jgi:hypothetical protein